jgi:serine protease inhibitor
MKKIITISYFLAFSMCALFAQNVEETVQGNNYFAFDLYQQLATINRENLIYSPFAISSSVAISYAGAQGKTAEEIASVFYFKQSGEALHANFRQINAKMRSKSGRTTLKIANRLWFSDSFMPKEIFRNICQQYYRGSTKAIDFEKPEQARSTMNNWASEQTQLKINGLLTEGAITPLTRLVLMNATYFKGSWANSFNVKNTVQDGFYVENGDQVKVPFMAQKNTFKYFKNDDLAALELPYEGGKYSMLLFLPKKEMSFVDFEAVFTAKNYYQWLNLLTYQPVNIHIPKFTLKSEEYALKGILRNMGMQMAFDENADFSGAFNSETPICIGNVFQKSFLSVDETGTVATAAAAATFQARDINEEITFRANRPFLYLVKDIQSGNIIFMGRVTNPK